MAVYCVGHQFPHSTAPAVCYRVHIHTVSGKCPDSPGGPEVHTLYVPPLETWTLETLRMVFHELAAYLPPDDATTAGVEARTMRRGGRPPKVPRPAEFDPDVRLWVEAHGWRASVWTQRDDRHVKEGEARPLPGDWSEPMQAVLLDLAAQSPIALAGVDVVYAADGTDFGVKPSRRNVVDGFELPDDGAKKPDPELAESELTVRARRWKRLSERAGGR